MTLTQILAESRDRLDDEGASNNLWSDAELTGHANLLLNELAEEKRLFRDSRTTAICNIAVLAVDVTADYLFDTRICEFISVRMNSQKVPLTRTYKTDIEAWNPDWRNLTAGTPQWYLTDYSEGYLTLCPKSSVNDTILLTVYRLPLTQLDSSTPAGLAASPELHFKHHPRLINGIMSLAFLKQDSQTYDPAAAERFRKLWQADKNAIGLSRRNLNDGGQFMGPNYGAI